MTRSRLVPVLLAATLLVGAANLGAYAATGAPLLLGKGNTATKTTKVKTTGNGAALSLKSKATAAPLAVSNSTKVTKLNADLVDGVEAAALQTKAYEYDLTAINIGADFVHFALPGLPPGRYSAQYSLLALVPGSPSFVGCFFVTGDPASSIVGGALGSTNGGGAYFVNGGGYLDTTAATYRFTCQRSGGASTTIPATSGFPARLVLTRLDDVTTASSTGAGATSSRGVAP